MHTHEQEASHIHCKPAPAPGQAVAGGADGGPCVQYAGATPAAGTVELVGGAVAGAAAGPVAGIGTHAVSSRYIPDGHAAPGGAVGGAVPGIGSHAVPTSSIPDGHPPVVAVPAVAVPAVAVPGRSVFGTHCPFTSIMAPPVGHPVAGIGYLALSLIAEVAPRRAAMANFILYFSFYFYLLYFKSVHLRIKQF